MMLKLKKYIYWLLGYDITFYFNYIDSLFNLSFYIIKT